MRSIRIAAVALIVAPAFSAPALAQMTRPGSPNYLQARADLLQADAIIRGRENSDRDFRLEHADEKSALGFLHGAIDSLDRAAAIDGLNTGAMPPPVGGTGANLAHLQQLLNDALGQLQAPEHNWRAKPERARSVEMLKQAIKRLQQAVNTAPR